MDKTTEQIQKLNEAITYLVAELNDMNNKLTTVVNQQNKNIEDKYNKLDSRLKLVEKETDATTEISYDEETERLDLR